MRNSSGSQRLAARVSRIAKDVYAEAHEHATELCAPYANVINIDYAKAAHTGSRQRLDQRSVHRSALRHDQADPAYNPSLRQLLHVGFKVAAKMGSRYLEALEANQVVIAKNVTANLFERHIRPRLPRPVSDRPRKATATVDDRNFDGRQRRRKDRPSAASSLNRAGLIFADADDFHPAANKAKMAAGQPLNDT